MPTTEQVIPRWRALNARGIAHAYLGRTSRAVCGAKTQDERYDWPRRSKCSQCLDVLGGAMAG